MNVVGGAIVAGERSVLAFTKTPPCPWASRKKRVGRPWTLELEAKRWQRAGRERAFEKYQGRKMRLHSTDDASQRNNKGFVA